MPDPNEPRREMPGELYPEWTTRPHAVHPGRGAAVDEPPVRPRLETRRPTRSLGFFLLVGVAVLLAVFFLDRSRNPLRRFATPEPRSTYTADAELEEAARARIASTPELGDADVTVVVREQVATVSGRVASVAAREKVLNVVRMTPGITGVIDHATVAERREPRESPRKE